MHGTKTNLRTQRRGPPGPLRGTRSNARLLDACYLPGYGTYMPPADLVPGLDRGLAWPLPTYPRRLFVIVPVARKAGSSLVTLEPGNLVPLGGVDSHVTATAPPAPSPPSKYSTHPITAQRSPKRAHVHTHACTPVHRPSDVRALRVKTNMSVARRELAVPAAESVAGCARTRAVQMPRGSRAVLGWR